MANNVDFKDEDEGLFSTTNLIVLTFVILLIILVGNFLFFKITLF